MIRKGTSPESNSKDYSRNGSTLSNKNYSSASPRNIQPSYKKTSTTILNTILRADENSIYYSGIRPKKQKTDSETCNICEFPFNALKKIVNKGFCGICQFATCSKCLGKKINDLKSCDKCFMRVKRMNDEIRRKDNLSNFDFRIEAAKRLQKKHQITFNELEKSIVLVENKGIEKKKQKEQEMANLRESILKLEEIQKKHEENNQRHLQSLNQVKEILKEKYNNLEKLKTQANLLRMESSSMKEALDNKLMQLKKLRHQKEELEKSVYFLMIQESFRELPEVQEILRSKANLTVNTVKGLSSIEPQKESFLGSFSGPANPFIEEERAEAETMKNNEVKIPKFNSEIIDHSKDTNTKDASKKSCDIY